MKRQTKLSAFIHRLQNRIRLSKRTFLLYSILRILVILTAIRCFFTGNIESFAICILSLILFLVPAFFEEKLKIDIPPLFEALIYLFIFAAEILGEVNKYYTTIPGWDTMLHTINGFGCAAIGFSLVEIMNRKSEHLNLSPMYLSLMAFCFSMTIGVLWEFFEFSMDHFFNMDMQKDFIVQKFASVTMDPTHSQKPFLISGITRTLIETSGGETYTVEGGYLDIGIIDTMKDLFVNFIGAVVFSVIGFIYEKKTYAGVDAGRSARIAGGLHLQALTDEELAEQDRMMEEQQKAIRRERQARRKRGKT